jgi:hypothetical protein
VTARLPLRIAAVLAVAVVAGPGARHAGAQRVVPFATASVVDDRVRVGGTETERASGSVWGIGAAVRFSPWLAARARIATGMLTARSPLADDRGYSEAYASVLLTPDTWITVDVGPVVRMLESSVVRQRWAEFRVGSEVTIPLLDEMIRATVRLSIAPMVSVTGQASPDLALGAGTGVQYVDGRFSATLAYDFDRYDFPPGPTGRRLEQRSALTARVGWRVR